MVTLFLRRQTPTDLVYDLLPHWIFLDSSHAWDLSRAPFGGQAPTLFAGERSSAELCIRQNVYQKFNLKYFFRFSWITTSGNTFSIARSILSLPVSASK